MNNMICKETGVDQSSCQEARSRGWAFGSKLEWLHEPEVQPLDPLFSGDNR
jgi:hypothetical protein